MSDLFAPGRIWEGQRVVIVAGGPSLMLRQVRAIGMACAAGRCKVIAVSDAVFPCWFADICYSADAKWWDHHQGLATFPGTKVSRNPLGRYDVRHLYGVDCADVDRCVAGVDGFDPSPGVLRFGPNSGHHAVHLAAQLGAAEIVIVAMDFTDKDFARDHWFGRHEGRMDMCSNTQDWRMRFRFLTDDLTKHGIRVVNASLASTVTWLPMVSLEGFL